MPYVIVSVVYYALAYPFLGILLAIQQPGVGKAIGWFTLIFVGPAILGLVLGINIQKNLFRIQTIEFWPCTEEETPNAPR